MTLKESIQRINGEWKVVGDDGAEPTCDIIEVIGDYKTIDSTKRTGYNTVLNPKMGINKKWGHFTIEIDEVRHCLVLNYNDLRNEPFLRRVRDRVRFTDDGWDGTLFILVDKMMVRVFDFRLIRKNSTNEDNMRICGMYDRVYP